MALLSAWELRAAADLPSEQRVARARMVALGLHDHSQALLIGRDMIRGYVKTGIRSRSLPELRADIDALNLRARPPARVLSVQVVADEPHAADADAAVDLRELFTGRAGDAARGLPHDTWTDTVAPALTRAVAQLEADGTGPVLVRATVRLPTWFFLGTRMRHVRDWTLLTEFADRVWSSRDVRAPAVHLAPPDPDDQAPAGTPPTAADPGAPGDGSDVQMPAGERSGKELLVAISVTADVAPEVLLSQQRRQLPDSDVLWLTVPTPGHTSVADPAAAAAIVDDARRTITGHCLNHGPYDRVHLVMAAPRMIALFLGHRWHRLPPVVVYEDLGAGRGYQPAFTIHD